MKSLIDHHVHSEMSGDSNTPMEKIVERGIELGLKKIMFTEHQDFDYPSSEENFELDVEKYFENIEGLEKQYSKIKVLKGIEIGYQPESESKINSLLEKYPFDFIICSVHAWDKKPFDRAGIFQGRTQKEGYEEYFKYLKYCVENFQNCDVYGHLDFIVRYGDFENKLLSYQDHKHIIDSILRTIIKNNKGIELNTSGLRYGLENMHPSREILERYLELGGSIISLGSDSHKASDLCADFDKALNMLREIGYTKIATFENRKVSFIDI